MWNTYINDLFWGYVCILVNSFLQMADVGRAHLGGDCNYGGGDGPPDDRDPRRLPSYCEASGDSSSDGMIHFCSYFYT